MSDFRLRGNVHQVGPRDFFVVAMAAPEVQSERPIFLTLTAASLSEAHRGQSRLLAELEKTVVSRGDRVLKIEAVKP
jgi:hypothetical protein